MEIKNDFEIDHHCSDDYRKLSLIGILLDKFIIESIAEVQWKLLEKILRIKNGIELVTVVHPRSQEPQWQWQ